MLVSVLSLGLGLGVNLTLFTAIRAVFFREPTLDRPARVVGVQPGNSNQFWYLNYRDLRDSGIFETVAGYRQVRLNLRSGGEAERVDGLAVTPNFFEAVRIPLALGRALRRVEAAPEREPRVAVISHAFWRRRFNASPQAVGREMTLNGESFTVIGVLPERYHPVTLLSDPAVYVPVTKTRCCRRSAIARNGNALGVLGWLRPGTTREQAQAAMTNLGAALEQRYPIDNRGMGRPVGSSLWSDGNSAIRPSGSSPRPSSSRYLDWCSSARVPMSRACFWPGPPKAAGDRHPDGTRRRTLPTRPDVARRKLRPGACRGRRRNAAARSG